MSPRTAGWCAIVGALAVAMVGGILLASPPWSIPGALVLVAASILLAVGIVWTYRRSWSEPWPPDVTPSRRQQLRRLQVTQVISSVLMVSTIALAVYAIADQDWSMIIWTGLFLALGCNNLVVNRRVLRQLRSTASDVRADPVDA